MKFRKTAYIINRFHGIKYYSIRMDYHYSRAENLIRIIPNEIYSSTPPAPLIALCKFFCILF